MNRKFLISHSIFLILAGIGGATASLIGYYYKKGIFSFLHNENLAVVGLFEAYLLACVCGVIILVGSKSYKAKFWHLLAALVHVPLIVTNILFWDYYNDFNMLNVGIIATVTHFSFIVLEFFFYLTQNQIKNE
jgi:phosphoglycerol transferase MdoB-like AlkP superfamily enzyme